MTISAALLPVVLFVGIGLSFAGFFGLAKYAWLPLGIRAGFVSVIFLVGAVTLVKALARGYRRVISALKMPMEMDAHADVNVICWPDQMLRMQPLIPPQGNAGAFEPEACRVWVARRKSLASKLQTRAQQIRFGLAAGTMPALLQILAQAVIHGWIDKFAIFGVVGVALLIPVAWGYLHPTFLRVSPGRIDIVRYRFLGGTPRIETHSLRDQPVRIDLRRKELLIGGWGPIHPEPPEPIETETPDREPSEAAKAKQRLQLANVAQSYCQASMGSPAQIRSLVIIPLWATLDVRTLQDAVFRASVSTAEPAPLPDDRLIG